MHSAVGSSPKLLCRVKTLEELNSVWTRRVQKLHRDLQDKIIQIVLKQSEILKSLMERPSLLLGGSESAWIILMQSVSDAYETDNRSRFSCRNPNVKEWLHLSVLKCIASLRFLCQKVRINPVI